MSRSTKITLELKKLIDLLIHKKFNKIAAEYSSQYKLTAEEIKEAIESYGGKLIMPPENKLADLELIEVREKKTKIWDGRFFLWTIDEGKSDLMLVLDIEEISENDIRIGIRDILVP